MDLRHGIWLVSGGRGSGKTTFCLMMKERACNAGWKTAGILSPAFLQNGIKTGIAAQDAGSGEQRLMAVIDAQPAFTLQVGKWRFDPDVVAWGSQVLADSSPCDLLMVDELGPLELIHGAGWHEALDVIKHGVHRHCLAVIRPELLEMAHRHFSVRETIWIDGPGWVAQEVASWWERMRADEVG